MTLINSRLFKVSITCEKLWNGVFSVRVLGTGLSLAHRSNCGRMLFRTPPWWDRNPRPIDHEPQVLFTEPHVHVIWPTRAMFCPLSYLIVLLVVIPFINTRYSNYLALSEAFVFMGNHKMMIGLETHQTTNFGDKIQKKTSLTWILMPSLPSAVKVLSISQNKVRKSVTRFNTFACISSVTIHHISNQTQTYINGELTVYTHSHQECMFQVINWFPLSLLYSNTSKYLFTKAQ